VNAYPEKRLNLLLPIIVDLVAGIAENLKHYIISL
jgi:hypothetical protein